VEAALHERFECGGQAYVEGHYDCIGFAEDLQATLDACMDDEEPLYDTTFTCYNQLNPYYSWFSSVGVPMYFWGHVLTDVHWPDGKISWIDGQLPFDEGVDIDNQIMDGNDDGYISYADGFCPTGPTDGDMNIRVYSSREEAQAAGEAVWDQH